jgi:hypothetical protein
MTAHRVAISRASMLGTEARQILINDVAINPASGNAYLEATSSDGRWTAAVRFASEHSVAPARKMNGTDILTGRSPGVLSRDTTAVLIKND